MCVKTAHIHTGCWPQFCLSAGILRNSAGDWIFKKIISFYFSLFSRSFSAPRIPFSLYYGLTVPETISDRYCYYMIGILPLKTCSTSHPLLHFRTCASLNSPENRNKGRLVRLFYLMIQQQPDKQTYETWMENTKSITPNLNSVQCL